MTIWDRLTYRWACWWLDSPRVDRLRQRDVDDLDAESIPTPVAAALPTTEERP